MAVVHLALHALKPAVNRARHGEGAIAHLSAQLGAGAAHLRFPIAQASEVGTRALHHFHHVADAQGLLAFASGLRIWRCGDKTLRQEQRQGPQEHNKSNHRLPSDFP